MATAAVSNKEFIKNYFTALSGNKKTEQFIDQYVSDPLLKQHILQAETAFPNYQLVLEHMVAEDDFVAVRATLKATHAAPFAGVPATGKTVSAGCMLFYRIEDGRISEHWMQLDMMSLMAQLTA
jgi:steroid delta-isomerase-like uncharacterized protein